MAKIAIIDDDINTSFFKDGIIQKYQISNLKICDNNTVQNSITHSTTCGLIIDALTTDYEIANIQVLESFGVMGNVMNLAIALEYCLSIHVDIIHMSIGTTILSLSSSIHPLIKKLHEKNIIMVAALSNEIKFTIPANFEEVIGVQCDSAHILKPGCLVGLSKNALGTEAAANSRIFLKKINKYVEGRNSFAVPIVVSYINGLINKTDDESKDSIIHNLRKKHPIVGKVYNSYYKRYILGISEKSKLNTPLVKITGDHATQQLCIAIMENLSVEHSIESVTFAMEQPIDVRIIDCRNIIHPVSFIERFVDKDIILALYPKYELNDCSGNDVDITVMLEDNSIKFQTIDNFAMFIERSGNNSIDGRIIGQNIISMFEISA